MKYTCLVAMLMLTACAQPDNYSAGRLRPVQAMTDVERQDAMGCYAQARAAGASAWGPNIVWQMAAQGQVERDVYVACMRGKGQNPF